MGNIFENGMKKRAESKIQRIFESMACEDPKNAIHGTAVAAAGVVALLPIGIDAWALRLCEIYMLMSIYAHYGMKISKATAESLMTAAFAQAVGEMAAYAALEAADAAAYGTAGLAAIPAYGIKVGIATGLIEAIGWTTVKHIEGNKLATAVIRVADGIGVAADVGRVVGVLTDTSKKNSSSSGASFISSQISFTGKVIEQTVDKNGNIVKTMEGYFAGRPESYYEHMLNWATNAGNLEKILEYSRQLKLAQGNRRIITVNPK